MLRRAVLTMVIVLIGGLIVQGVEELAELHVTTITLDPPSSITRGVDVEVRARIMNTGQRTADPVNVGFFYRPMSGSSSWILAETIESGNLAPSQEDYLEVTFVLETSDLELGAYQIRIVADPLNQISEVDELNNELTTSFLLTESSLGLSDLQPTSLTYSPTNPESLDDMLPWNVSVTVENPTPTQAGPFTVAFLLDGEEFDRKFLFALPAGGTVEVVGEFDPFALNLSPGTYEISVLLDPDEQVSEQDEANNTITGALTLLSPDLYPVSLSFDKTVIRLDEEVHVSATIANGGDGSAKNVEVGFYLDQIRFALVQVPLLGRGLTTTVETILSPDELGLIDAPEIHDIEIVVDPNETVPELDEANNRITRTVTILDPTLRMPEVHPEGIELGPASPVELGRSDNVTVTSAIRNTGRALAEDFTVTFAYRVKGGMRWETFPCSSASGCSGLTLASGMQTKLTAILPVALLAPGIYEIRVLVDATSIVSELDESNNEMVTTLTLLAPRLPDLSFSLTQPVRVEPSTQVHQGQTLRFTPTVTNLGDVDAGPFYVRFSYQNMLDASSAQPAEFRTAHFSPGAEILVRSLAIGETAEIPVLLETRDLMPGQYLIQMEIDPATAASSAGQVGERNENNNIISSQVSVLGPDLTVLDVYTVPNGIVDQSTVESVDVVATIINSGVSAAGEFTVQFQLLGIDDAGAIPIRVHSCSAEADCGAPEFFGEVTLPGIGTLVPEQVRCTLDLESADLAPGQYVIRILVDCDAGIGLGGTCVGQIAEHNETNNILEIPLIISGIRAVDLAIDSLTVTPDEEDTSRLIITTTVSNLGVRNAGAFQAVLRLLHTPDECAPQDSADCRVTALTKTALIPGLEGLASYPVSWSVALEDLAGQPAGEWAARVDVDCDGATADTCQGRIEESDEANNAFTLRLGPDIIVGTEPPPEGEGDTDLVIQSFHAVEMSGTPSESQIWATIINRGPTDVGEFYVRFYYVDGTGERIDLNKLRVRGLAAGTDTSVLAQFDTSGLAKGYYVAGVIIDVDGDILESNESNNNRETDLLIR